MTRAPRRPPGDGPAAPRLAGAPASRPAWPRFAVAAAVLVAGCLVAWATARAAARSAADQERLAADQTANVLSTSVRTLLAAVAGVSGLPDADGDIDEDRFLAYARAVAAESPFDTLAYVPVVPATEREALEASIDRRLFDRPGGPPAPERPEHLPVLWVTPLDDVTEPLVGLDLAGDDVRLSTLVASRDRGTTAISTTVTARTTGERSVFVAHPVYRAGTSVDASVAERRRAVVGYVTTILSGDELLVALRANVAEPPAMRISDAPDAGAAVLAESDPPVDEGTTVERTAGGRPWRVTVDEPEAPTRAAWTILGGSIALSLALALLGWRALRHQRQVERHVALVEGIAGLGRSLTAAASVDELTGAVAAEVPAVLGADTARVWELRTAGRARPEDAASLPGAVVQRWITDPEGRTIAALEVAWARERDIDDLRTAGVSTIAEMCGQTLVRARLADQVRRDAVSSRLLAGLAEAAATAGTTQEVARTLVDRAAEVAGAASSHIGLLDEARRSLVVVHRGQADRADVVPLDGDHPLAVAYREGPVLLGTRRAVAERFPGVAREMQEADLAAMACVPLVGADRRALGALGLAWEGRRRFDPELADVLRTTADLCASSLERARETDRAQARSSAMTDLASHLSAASTFEEVGAAIIEHATTAVGADFALVGVVEGDRFRLLAPSGPELDVLAPYTDIELDGEFPALLAWRRRELVAFSAADVPDAEVAADLARMGLQGGACAPLPGSDGSASGAFMVLWADPPPLDDALRSRISTVADLCAQSVERSRLFDEEHRVRSDLQRSVLAEAPAVPGLDVATRYRPAARSLGMGGDWYDAVTLPGGRLCLVVGDVTGHGVGAVAEMTQIRTVIHTLAAGGVPLPQILERTSAVMRRDGLGYATVLIAVIDPDDGAVEYVTAGHPPAMLRRPGGTVDTLTGGRSSVLGIRLATNPPGQVSFPPGSTLVIYTDGLIERRDTPIDASIRALADEVRTCGATSADELADALLGSWGDKGPARDDVAVVVARRTA
ncbi:MAG TPA: SpoIIE family protein phosphatase [Acidimicrobiales bacterium]